MKKRDREALASWREGTVDLFVEAASSNDGKGAAILGEVDARVWPGKRRERRRRSTPRMRNQRPKPPSSDRSTRGRRYWCRRPCRKTARPEPWRRQTRHRSDKGKRATSYTKRKGEERGSGRGGRYLWEQIYELLRRQLLCREKEDLRYRARPAVEVVRHGTLWGQAAARNPS